MLKSIFTICLFVLTFGALCQAQPNEASQSLSKVSGNIYISTWQGNPLLPSLHSKVQIWAYNIESQIEYSADIKDKKYSFYLPKGFYEIKSSLYGFRSWTTLLHVKDTTHYYFTILFSHNIKTVHKIYSPSEKGFIEGEVWLINKQREIKKMKGLTNIWQDGSKSFLTMLGAVKEDTQESFEMFVDENGHFEGWLPEGSYVFSINDIMQIQYSLETPITLERGQKYKLDLYALGADLE